MPGSFPECPLPATSEQELHTASHALDLEQETNFVIGESTKSNARSQTEIIQQLGSLSYILVYYQLIKYCHLACMTPVMLHLAVQNILRPNFIKYGVDVVERVLQDPSSQELTGPNFNRQVLFNMVRKRIIQAIYWKLIFTILYHVIFVVYWMIPLILDGHATDLEHGSWWFISFIGEAISMNVDKNGSNWNMALQLGLPYLILTDVLIFMIQLVSYQCLYVQSTLVPLALRVGVEGPSLVKMSTDNSLLPRDNQVILEDRLPLTLTVNLYEAFEKDKLF
ncbi:uncharacterized protein KQ657_003336 [Scheffersomyces spartinae]|uniref:Uncharacterized protein n=1 Tax=Scheffersomyces spartinae TaxID=45513 RepID=A0A9P7VCX5_9ASCO|nr:uncharacterized protein KQ657_003336 [Scheffersomyces spartinae]KAG7195569.1 hypothetical protein KQ657_003336 [Scheffersomyces spartinae]